MGEHLNITSDLLKQGLPAFEMNRHTGETPPIAGYRLSYMTEKMECIFDGLITVTAASRSEEHTSELQSLMRISYAVFCLKKKKKKRYQLDTPRKLTQHNH